MRKHQTRKEPFRCSSVDVGNPHAVVVGDPDELPRIGPLLESHPRFPGRTNVQVARIARPGRVSAHDVVVSFPGGDLLVRLEGDHAWLTGPAERVR